MPRRQQIRAPALSDSTPPKNRIRFLRRRSRLTQQELAKLMDLDDSTVSKHEAGERSLDSDIISRYAKVFKCQSFELFVRPEKPTIFYG